MQQVSSTFFPFGPPVYMNNIDPKYVEEMLQHVDTAQMTPNQYDKRDSLAGRIDDQYTIESLTSDACKGHILQHVSQYNFDVGGLTDGYEISGLWVNLQRYMELNPMHSHDGMFSFVIFLKNELNREETINNNKYQFSKVDLCDSTSVQKLINNFKPDIIFNLAAETHVDRSIVIPINFINSNIV